MALLILFSGFVAVILVGSILVAINDAIEAWIARAAQVGTARGGGARAGGARPGLRPARSLRHRPRLSSTG